MATPPVPADHAPRPPLGTISLLLLMIVVALLQQFLGMELVEVKPDVLKPLLLPLDEFSPLQWITSVFFHDGWGQLIVNLPFLWLFAVQVEQRLGKLKFQAAVLALCLGCGLLTNIGGLMFGLKGLDQGADGLLFGLMAIALVWEPEHIVARPAVGGKKLPLPLAAFAALRLLLEPALLALEGHSWALVLLHPLGLALGAGLGLLLMQIRWADCEGWDLLTRLKAGKLGQGRPQVVQAGPASTRNRGDAEALAKEHVAAITALVDAKAWDAALVSWQVNQGDQLDVPAAVRERLIKGLLATEKIKEAKPLLNRFLEENPGNLALRLAQAQVLLRDKRPAKALDALAMLQGKPLQPAQVEKARALEKMARDMLAEGVLEMDE